MNKKQIKKTNDDILKYKRITYFQPKDQVLINKKERTRQVDFAIPADHRVQNKRQR